MANAILLRGGGNGVDCDNATATAADIVSGYTAGIAGNDEPVNGTMANRGAVNTTINAQNGTYTILAGYHNGGGKVAGKKFTEKAAYTITPSTSAQIIPAGTYMTGNVTIAGNSNLAAGNIKKGVVIGNVTGTVVDYSTTQKSWM